MPRRIAIIGGGPGGYVAAIRAAQLGAEVHLIEKAALGGTCLNVGCIPTKALLHVAETYQSLLHGETLGIKAERVTIDWPTVLRYQKNLVKRLVGGVEGLLKANKIAVHQGHARLQGPGQIDIGGTSLKADTIILAVGSEPARIPVPGLELEGVIDSTGALNLSGIPESMVIIGGGVIGVEFAAIYNAFGTKVTIVEMLPQILPGVDDQIVGQVREDLGKKGIRILTGAQLREIRRRDSKLQALVDHGSQESDLTADKILVAVGRRPRTEGLGLEALGVKLDRGRIPVDGYFLTNFPQLYAIGDCSSGMMLAHVASAQGVAAVEHALGHKPAYFGHIIPACIYTHPEIAAVGLTEEQARAKGLEVHVGVFPLAGNGKALIESAGKGLVKIVAGAKYKEILGVHIWGPRATDLIAEAALAMRLEATIDELISTIHAHPTIGEAMPEAALDVEGLAIHWPPGLKKK